MLLEDYSQLFIAAALAQGDSFKSGGDVRQMENILRHTTLNTLLSDKRKFGNTYGQIVLACDGDDYWRRAIFPHYKAGRKKARTESGTDWGSIFSIADSLRNEFVETFPFKIVRTSKAEADDIIAVLCKWSSTNALRKVGVFDDEPDPVLIKSSDGDFAQLHKYSHVRQWDPINKKYIATKPGSGIAAALLDKLLRGDKGDGIPNILSSDDQLVRGERQRPITQAIVAKATNQIADGKLVYFGDKVMDSGLARNKKLIDFDNIPEDVAADILTTYETSVPVKDKSKIFNYFVQHRCRLLMEHIQDF